MSSLEHSQPSPEMQQDTAPRFVVAKELEYNPDINAPRYEIQDQPDATLPELSAEQLNLMGRLTPEEWSAEKLDSLGLPVGEGIVAVSVDGEKRYVNISLEDYGTTIIDRRIRVVPGAESAERNELPSEEVREELGEAAFEALGVEEPEEAAEEQAEVHEVAEQINELPEETREAVQLFLNQGEQEVQGLLDKTRDEAQFVDEMKNFINRLRYSGVDVSSVQGALQQQMEMAGQLRNMLQGDADSGLRSVVTRFRGELEGSLDKVKRDEKTGDELAVKVRRLDSATEEMEMMSRRVTGASDELAADAGALLRAYDEMMHDRYGGESYAALISQKLTTIEDNLMRRRASLMRAQDELPAVRGALQ